MQQDWIARAQQLAEPVSFGLPWGEVRGLRWGDPNAQPVLCLHGWLDNAHSFLPLAGAFCERPQQQLQLLALDWAGHGDSDHRPAGNHYYFLDYVYDLWHICQQQQWQPLICAHSMGAFAANLLAGIAPDLVRGLYSIEAFGLLLATPEQSVGDLREGFASRFDTQAKLQSEQAQRFYSSFEQGVTARAGAGDFSRDIATLLVQRGMRQVAEQQWQFKADLAARTKSAVRMTAPQVANVLREIVCPMRLLRGATGYQSVLQQLDEWASCVPQLEIVEHAGGHHVHMEAGAWLWKDFVDFVKRHELI